MTSSAASLSGGCQCGRIRYRLNPPPTTSHLCHCRMCQKASGNIFAALACVSVGDLNWTRGTPAKWRSSDSVDRGFCSVCGTPLFYRDIQSSDIAIMVGSLDVPSRCPAASHHGTESRIWWLLDLADLPDHREEDTPKRRLWAKSISRSNRQHPDFDTLSFGDN